MKSYTQILETESILSVLEALKKIFYQTKTVLIIRYLVADKISTIRTTLGFKKMGPKLSSLGAKNWLA